MRTGEFELIEQIRNEWKAPEGVLGIGDDCAVLPQRPGVETLVSTDMLVEGVHFLMEDIDAFSLGWKSAAVNISDIAAMGGSPVGSFLGVAIPKNLDDVFINGFLEGYKALSDKFDCPLLGGDTTSSTDKLCISVTVLGECPQGKSVKRGGAREGDLVCVCGSIGDSAAGLRCILGSPGAEFPPLEKTLVARHYRPLPMVREGILLREKGVHSMMDVSDGVASDLRHILKASGVGARVDCRNLPLSEELRRICSLRGWDPVSLALEGGEDYALLFTAAPRTIRNIGVPHHVIGEILPKEEGMIWDGSDRDLCGFRHF